MLPPALRRLVRSSRRLVPLLLAAACAFGCLTVSGRSDSLMPNLALPTAGGSQLWADVAWDRGWRVQRHVWTGHGRLLDPGDVRRAWGSEQACRERLEALAGPASDRPVVVLLHGLWRTRDSMAPLGEALRDAGHEVMDVTYPSTRRTIAEHAEQVAGLLDGLRGEGREVSFVTHSLGALVTRALLARGGDPWRERHRLGRAVFIAPPHRGAALARVGEDVPGALALYGEPSREIAGGIAASLPSPPLPFLDVAASRGTEGGWNPLVPGDDDGVVAVDETRLEGESARLVVRGTHTFVMRDPEVVEAAVRFLADR